MKNRYEHIFFDLDKTLWHFEENSLKVLNELYVQFDLASLSINVDDFIIKYKLINEELWTEYEKGLITKEQLRSLRFNRTLLRFNIVRPELADEISIYYIENSPYQTTLLPHTIKVLDYLVDNYKLHIITNGFEEVQYIKLKQSGIGGYFKEVILSEKVGVKKPHPLIFKHAFKKASAKSSNSLMIGDNLYADIYGAKRVKMDHIYFNHYNEPHNEKVDKEINCLSELLDIL